MVRSRSSRELTFDEATHLYRLRGAELPSVTTTVRKPLSSEVYGGVDEWVMERAAGRGRRYITPSRTGHCTASRTSPRYRGYFGFLAWVHDMKPEVLGNEVPALPQRPSDTPVLPTFPASSPGKRSWWTSRPPPSSGEMLARGPARSLCEGLC